MFDELAKTVKAQLYERVSSPLLGAFTISWVVWNYRFVLLLLSSMPIADKFFYIDNNIFNSPENIFLRGSLYPLLTSLLLIFVYPIPAKFVYGYWRKRQRELKEVQQRIDDETPLTREEARELRQETLKVTLEFEQEIERRLTEIAKLKEVIKELQPSEKKKSVLQSKQEKMPPQEAAKAVSRLTEEQTAMLKKIAESTDGLAMRPLIASSGSTKVLAEYNLGELEAKQYVSKDYSNGDYRFRATHPGRTYLVNQAPNA